MRSCNYFFVNALFQSSNFTEEPTTPSKLYEEYEKIYQLVRDAISNAKKASLKAKSFQTHDFTRVECPRFDALQMIIKTKKIDNFILVFSWLEFYVAS